MVDIIFWIFFGALVGWVAAILHGLNATARSAAYITIGALGGLSGGLSGLFITSGGVEYTTQTTGLTFALFGAMVFVALARYAYNQQSHR